MEIEAILSALHLAGINPDLVGYIGIAFISTKLVLKIVSSIDSKGKIGNAARSVDGVIGMKTVKNVGSSIKKIKEKKNV
jgi:hypothetical protein